MRSYLYCTIIYLVLAISGVNAQGPIQVGKTVHVTTENGNRPFSEVIIGSHPTDPKKLIACGMAHALDRDQDPGVNGNPKSGTTKRTVVAYVSDDGGKTWRHGFTVPTTPPADRVAKAEFIYNNADPDCGFGPDGTAFVVGFYTRNTYLVPPGDGAVNFIYRSNDGKNWDVAYTEDAGDREWMCVDNTNGPRRGWMYIPYSGANLIRSKDGGKTWEPPRKIGNGTHIFGRCSILPDGSLAVGIQKGRDGMELYVSSDGGETFTGNEIKGLKNEEIIGIATDHSSGPFRGRIYVVWNQIIQIINDPLRKEFLTRIRLAYSDDLGKTWSSGVTVNDERPWRDGSALGPAHRLPTVAVNKNGVVGVMWYDRRDHRGINGGYTPRFRASLDGGDNWLPSVPITDKSHDPQRNEAIVGTAQVRQLGSAVTLDLNRYEGTTKVAADDTNGLTATTDGVFHPLWVDNRNGISQIYTSPITVKGIATKGGVGSLASSTDITDRVVVVATSSNFDNKTKRFTLGLRIYNRTKETIQGPLKIAFSEVKEGVASITQLNADDLNNGFGPIWDFTPLLTDGRLPPRTSTAIKNIEFQLSDIDPIDTKGLGDGRFGTFKIKVYSGAGKIAVK